MSSLKYRCPNPQCRLTLHVPGKMQGQTVRCAGCGRSFLVPPAGLTRSAKADKKRGKDRTSKAA